MTLIVPFHIIVRDCAALLCAVLLLRTVSLSRALGDESAPVLLDYTIKVETILSQDGGGKWYWFLPFVAPIPNAEHENSSATVMMIMKSLITSDHYSGPYITQSGDNGMNWSKPSAPFGEGWQVNEDGTMMAVSDITPGWHVPTGKVLAIGGRVRHNKEGHQILDKPRSEEVVYTVYDPTTDDWSPLRTLELPDIETIFFLAISSCGQWLIEDDGSLLIPIYFRGAFENNFSSCVLHCRFDGTTLKYLEHGNKVSLDISRGAYEPSLAHYRGRYYLTIRNDEKGYLVVPDKFAFVYE